MIGEIIKYLNLCHLHEIDFRIGKKLNTKNLTQFKTHRKVLIIYYQIY
jgi:hypothetical protein